jgi:hypothetical protein
MSFLHQSRKDYVKQLVRTRREFMYYVDNLRLGNNVFTLPASPASPTQKEIAEAEREIDKEEVVA